MTGQPFPYWYESSQLINRNEIQQMFVYLYYRNTEYKLTKHPPARLPLITITITSPQHNHQDQTTRYSVLARYLLLGSITLLRC